jgi:hypothetical protein
MASGRIDVRAKTDGRDLNFKTIECINMSLWCNGLASYYLARLRGHSTRYQGFFLKNFSLINGTLMESDGPLEAQGNHLDSEACRLALERQVCRIHTHHMKTPGGSKAINCIL